MTSFSTLKMGSVARLFLRKTSNFPGSPRDQCNIKTSHLSTPTIYAGTLIAIVIFGEDVGSFPNDKEKEEKNQWSRAYLCSISPASDLNSFKENKCVNEDIEVFMLYNHSIYFPLKRREDCTHVGNVNKTQKSKVIESMNSVKLALGGNVSVQELYYITDANPQIEADSDFKSFGSIEKSNYSFCTLSKRRIGDTLSGIKGCVFHISSTSKEGCSYTNIPSPLLSITLTLDSDDARDTEVGNVVSTSLLQQCVKRKLAGSLVVCTKEFFYHPENGTLKNCKVENNTNSIVAIGIPSLVSSVKLDLKYRVLHVVPSESSSTLKNLYQILPSTRITIYTGEDRDIAEKEIFVGTQEKEAVREDMIHFEENANPTSLLLINTIRAIQDYFFSHDLNCVDDRRFPPRADIPRAYLLGGPPGVGTFMKSFLKDTSTSIALKIHCRKNIFSSGGG